MTPLLSSTLGYADREGIPQAKAVPTPRSAATAVPKAKATVAPPFAGYLTPAQQAAQAAAQASANILPQQQALARAQAADAATAKAQATDTTGYYAALAGILKGIAPAVNTGYTNAAGADVSFAKGYSDGLAHVQGQAGQTNADVLGVSGGGVQANQVAQQTGGTGIQDALYGLTGYIPATGLEREGAAFGAAAAQQPATAAGFGAQQLARLSAQEQLNQNQFAQQAVDLKAQLPGLTQTARNAIVSQQNQLTSTHNQAVNASVAHADRQTVIRNKALVDKVAASDRAASLQIATIVATGQIPDGKGGYTLSPAAQQKIAAVQQGNERVRIAAMNAQTAADRAANDTKKFTISQQPKFSSANSKSLGYRADQFGNPINGKITPLPGYKLNDAGTGTVKVTAGKVAKTTANPGFPNLTKAQVVHLRSGVSAAFYGVPEQKDVNGNVTAAALPPVDYETAISHAISAGYSRAGATRMANRFYMPGKRGRPKK